MTDRSHPPRRIGGENILVLCFAVLTALYFYNSFYLQRTLMSDFVGPALFPQLVAGGALILALIYFFQQRIAKARGTAEDGAKGGAEMSALFPIIPIVLYVLILEPLGFLLATTIYVFVAMLQFGQTIARSFAYAVIMAIAFFILFYYLLLTHVPMGWLVDTEQLLPFLMQLRRVIGG